MITPLKNKDMIEYFTHPDRLKNIKKEEADQLIKKLTGILAICVFLIIPAFSLYYCIDVKIVGTYGNSIPIVQVDGKSMQPTLTQGELVTYYTPDKKPIEVGSIIIYKKAITKVPVIHRVTAIWPDGTMTTKGDNNPDTDQASFIDSRNVTQSDVIGIVSGPLFQ